jgi:hypothetical protein
MLPADGMSSHLSFSWFQLLGRSGCVGVAVGAGADVGTAVGADVGSNDGASLVGAAVSQDDCPVCAWNIPVGQALQVLDSSE